MRWWTSPHISIQRKFKNIRSLKIYVAFEEPLLLHVGKEARPG